MGSKRRTAQIAAFAAGSALGLLSLVLYAGDGWVRGVFVLWLAGLALLAVAFAAMSERLPRVARADVLAPVGLALAFAPLYLARTYSWPAQVSSDEVSVMTNAAKYASRDGVDLFGVSDYLGHPAALLVVWGQLGEWLGGVDLTHMRLLHGMVGLAVIAASYALFRQLLPLRWAVFAACVIGCSHSLLMFSRMALRENTAVLLEVVAIALLLRGLRHGHRLTSFLGGVVAGLGWYVYYPARFTIVIWAMVLVGVFALDRSRPNLRRLGNVATATAIGFVLVATPIFVSEQRAPADVVALQRHALMIYPEARQLQRDWVFASSEWEAIRTNIGYGLTAFNNRVPDHSWLYENPSHGFVDPLTGVLLWIGAAIVLVTVVRRRGDPWLLVPLAAFLLLWLVYALLVNKAPNYTRLLVTLPFVAVLVTVAVRSLAGAAVRVAGRSRLPLARRAGAALAVGCLLAIATWNISIARDFVDAGTRDGDTIGDTGRYIEANSDVPGKTFYLATEDADPYKYFDWGYPIIWNERLRIFAGDRARVGEVIAPDALAEFPGQPPFAVFMRRELWDKAGARLMARYGPLRTRDILPDGSLVVLEVPAFE